jgi:hypothetical protein
MVAMLNSILTATALNVSKLFVATRVLGCGIVVLQVCFLKNYGIRLDLVQSFFFVNYNTLYFSNENVGGHLIL